MFNNPQDRDSLRKAVDACNEHEMWSWSDSMGREVIHPIEKARHFGMICGCEQHLLDRENGKVHIPCPWNGKRLPESWPFLAQFIAQRAYRAKHVTPADCSGDMEDWRSVKNGLQRTSGGTKLRFGYLSLVPWAFCRSGTIEGARAVMEQVNAKPLEQHDECTQYIMRAVGADINRRSQGEDITEAHQQVVDMYSCSADEGAGETYHRGTTHEKKPRPIVNDRALGAEKSCDAGGRSCTAVGRRVRNGRAACRTIRMAVLEASASNIGEKPVAPDKGHDGAGDAQTVSRGRARRG